jgi:hypothetical protein
MWLFRWVGTPGKSFIVDRALQETKKTLRNNKLDGFAAAKRHRRASSSSLDVHLGFAGWPASR